jgi:hypothetical protein
VCEEGRENTALFSLASPAAPTERSLTGCWCHRRQEREFAGPQWLYAERAQCAKMEILAKVVIELPAR